MSLSIVKANKKVSCTVCRKKKLKCDGLKPCSRCSSRNIQYQCTYAKPGQVGRPPKNAVWNKLAFNKTKQQLSNNNSMEFIFENIGDSIPWHSQFINNDSTKNLYYFIESFFNNEEAILQLAVIRIAKAIPCLPDIKMYDLLEFYTWTLQDMVNIVSVRLGSIPLDNFCYFDSIACAVFQDLALKYFSEPHPEIPIGNPLSTISSQQSIRLIEAFFSINPHCILLNKTMIMQGFWTESIEPLLLAVIYGTTTYLSRLLEGKPATLWGASTREERNPFLEYAYCLIQKSSSISLTKLQAVVILGLFESVFGFPKRGMATLGLGFLICKNLGVANGSFQAKCNNNIQAELANISFWSLFNGTIRGSVDLGHIPHCDKDELSLDLPPPTLNESVSYQFEEASGDARLFRSYYYLQESFYIQTVTCKFTYLILQQLPEVKYSMYYPEVRHANRHVGFPKPDDLIPRLHGVIQEFDDFIQGAKYAWSIQQTYTIEMVWSIYDIHLDFLKKIGPVVDGTNYGNAAYDFLLETPLLPDDPFTMARVHASIHKIYAMIDKTSLFLSDPTNYNEQPLTLPRLTLVSVLETATEVLLLKFSADSLDVVTFGYLKMVNGIAHRNIWADFTTIFGLHNKLREFFSKTIEPTTTTNGHSFLAATLTEIPTITIPTTEEAPSLSPVSPLKSFGSPTDNQSFVGTELSIEDELSRAAFFDPCATWLDPITPLAMDLRLLDVIDTFPTLTESMSPTTSTYDTSNDGYYDTSGNDNSMMATPATPAPTTETNPVPEITIDNTYLQEFESLNIHPMVYMGS